MRSRVIQVRGIPERDRRKELTRFLQDESIRDGVIQGGSVRLVLSREALEKERYGLSLTEPSEAVAVNPSFEDGFIDRLGGIVQRSSPLAQGFHSIPKSEKPPVVAEGLTKRYGSFTAAVISVLSPTAMVISEGIVSL